MVIRHAADKAHRGRRIAFRWLIQGEDDARLGIAAGPVPGQQVVQQQDGQAAQADQQGTVVPEQVADLFSCVGFVHITLGPGDDDGHALVRGQRSGAFETGHTVRVDPADIVLSFRALGTGIGLGADDVCRDVREADAGGDMVDGEYPAIAGDVPVQLVMILEKPQLSLHAVTDTVFVDTVFQVAVGIADIDAQAVGPALGMVVLAMAVTHHGQQLEIGVKAVAEPVLVVGGDVAVDASAYVAALSLYADGLGDVDVAGRQHHDVAVEIQYAFRRPQGQGTADKKE